MRKQKRDLYNKTLVSVLEIINKNAEIISVGHGKTFLQRIISHHYKLRTLSTIYYAITWFEKYHSKFDYYKAILSTSNNIVLYDNKGIWKNMIIVGRIGEDKFGIKDIVNLEGLNFISNVYDICKKEQIKKILKNYIIETK